MRVEAAALRLGLSCLLLRLGTPHLQLRTELSQMPNQALRPLSPPPWELAVINLGESPLHLRSEDVLVDDGGDGIRGWIMMGTV